MKKFTRLASIALCLTLAVLALAACGKKDDDTDPDYVPAVTQMHKANIGVYQHRVVGGAADKGYAITGDTAITETSNVITIKANADASMVAINLADYFKGDRALADGFSFTRSDRFKKDADGEFTTELETLYAYKFVKNEDGANVYTKYGSTTEIVDAGDTAISGGALYGEIFTPIDDDASVKNSVVYIYPVGDVAEADDAEAVTQVGFQANGTVNFVFKMKNGDTYKLSIKVENAA